VQRPARLTPHDSRANAPTRHSPPPCLPPQYEPSVPADVSEYIVDEYVAMRKHALEEPDRFVSARTLLAILRLSQALARLRCSNEVNRDDIIEARRLMEVSRSSITAALEDQQSRRAQKDTVSAVYRIIVDYAKVLNVPAVKMADVLGKVLSRGLTREDFQNCIDEYKDLGVWFVSDDKAWIRFVDKV